MTTSRDTGLFGRTVKCKLGGVDAFVSHSWHDSGGAKWALLTRWAKGFLLVHGREPVVWLDKGCIDQQVCGGVSAATGWAVSPRREWLLEICCLATSHNIRPLCHTFVSHPLLSRSGH